MGIHDHSGLGFGTRFRFNEEDLVLIDGTAMRVAYRNSEGTVLNPAEGAGPTQHFSHAEIADLVRHNRLEVRRGHFLPASARHILEVGEAAHSLFDGSGEERMRFREAVVLGFHAIQRQQRADEGRVRLVRTDGSIEDHRSDIERQARGFYAKHAQSEKAPKTPEKFTARSLRRWLNLHDQFGRMGLSDNYGKSGNKHKRFDPEVVEILEREIQRFLDPNRPTKKIIHLNVQVAIMLKNEERAAKGLEAFPTPSRNAVSAAIDRLDPFVVAVAREGREAAVRRLRQTGRGISPDLVRPLQRVEMDEFKIDIFASLKGSGLLNLIKADDQKRLGLTPTKGRWWVTVAMCATTRVILGMRLSRNPNQFSALDCLEMSLLDKGRFAASIGACSPWSMAGLMELLVTDGGSAFKAASMRAACADLGVRHEIAVNGLPQLRARIERLFRTIGVNLLPRLSGRSFESVAARGDHDGEAQAALTVDDLTTALVRWVVDVYHNNPHDGLRGQTPIEAWDEGMRTWGVNPPPGPGRIAQIFARPLKRKLEGDGVTVMGVRYHSRELAEHRLHSRIADVEVRWYPGDLGAVWVRTDRWIRVPAVFDGFSGVTASEWLKAVANMRLSLQAGQEASRKLVLHAIQEIDALNAAARARAGLISETWSAETIEHLEDGIFVGFRVSEEADEPETASAADGIGQVIAPLRIEPDEAPDPEFRPQRQGRWDIPLDWDVED